MEVGKNRGRFLIIFALIAVIISALTLVSFKNVAFAYNTYQTFSTDQEMLSAANTYDCTEVVDGANGVYKTTYDLSQKNGRQVMGYPQITVLTHGLGGSASDWSNIIEGNKAVFASDEQSLIQKLETKGSNSYWAKMENVKDFSLYFISGQNGIYTKNNKKIDDISKHIVIVFEAYDSGASNDSVYYEFNHMLSKVVFDVAYLNGGILPKVNLIGHSRGGITNLQYALDHPDLVDSLISIGTPYFGTTTGRLFGEQFMGPSVGLDSILDPAQYYRYNQEWNSNYEARYKNINAVSIGGYTSFNFLSEIIRNDQSGLIEKITGMNLSTLADLTQSAMNVVAIGKISTFGLSPAIGALTELLNYYFPDSQVLDAFEILFSELNFDFQIPCFSFYNDILTDLDSQLGNDLGNQDYVQSGSYKGFKRLKRLFKKDDGTVLTKVAQPMPPAPHNLETRDAKIIEWIVESCQFGANQNSAYRTAPVSDTEVKITGYRGEIGGTFVVPETIEGRTVVEIGDYAFSDNFGGNNVSSVQIPSTVRKIGHSAFENCTKLETVEFTWNPSVTVLGNSAFANCEKLSFPLPATLIEIGSGAFANCVAFDTIQIGANVASIGEAAFLNCRNLKAFGVAAPNSAFKAEAGALFDKEMTKLIAYPSAHSADSFTLPATINDITSYSFYNNQNLKTVSLNNVKTIGEGAFYGSAVTKIKGGDNVIEIGSNAFDGTSWYDKSSATLQLGSYLLKYNGTATELTAEDFATNITKIYDFAFMGNGLQKIEFSENVKEFGHCVFSDCKNLQVVKFESVAPIQGNKLFLNTDGLQRVYFRSQNAPIGFIFGNAAKPTVYVPMTAETEYRNSSYLYGLTIETVETVISFSDEFHSIPNQKAVFGSILQEMPVPINDNYIFDGWYDNAAYEGLKYQEGSYWDKNSDTTLYAKWIPKQYVISFGGEGTDNLAPMIVSYGTFFGDLPLPQREGYEFIAWKTVNGDVFTGNQIFTETENVSLTAEWKAKEYLLQFHANGGSIHQESKTVTYGLVCGALPVPVQNGYLFTGWNTVAEGSGTAISAESVYRYSDNLTIYAQWEVVRYQIFYDLDGGVATAEYPNSYTIEDTPLQLTCPVKTGCTFVGWQIGNSVSFTIPAGSFGNLNLVAVYQLLYYDIKLEDGHGNLVETTRAAYEQSLQNASQIPEREGFDFEGYFDSDGKQYYNSKGEGICLWDKTVAATLYARWIVKNFEVIIDEDGSVAWIGIGGLVEEKTLIPYGTQFDIAELTNQYKTKYGIRAGYRFLGFNFTQGTVDWSYIPDLGKNGKRETLTADWQIETYLIKSYDKNGKEIANKNYQYGENIELGVIEIPNYTFSGWYDAPAGGNKIHWTKVPDLTPDIENNGECSVYARYEPVRYNIEYVLNGGENSALNPNYGTIESDFQLIEPRRTGYHFDGWFTDSQFTYRATTLNGLEADETFYAKWTANVYYINFDKNGGEGSMAKERFTYDTRQTLYANSFTKKYYKFIGWALDPNAKVPQYQDREIILNLLTQGETIFYAIWDIYPYTVIFDANDGRGQLYSENFITNTPKPLPENTFIRNGYEFIGWSEIQNSNTAKYSDQETVINLPVQTLYAVWNIISYQIIYHNPYGQELEPTTYTVEDTLILPKPKRFGYDFSGWSDALGNIYDTITKGSVGNLTLSAQWYGFEYKVGNAGTYDINPANCGGYKTVLIDLSLCEKNSSVAYYYFIGTEIQKISFLGESTSTQQINIRQRTNTIVIAMKDVRMLGPMDQNCIHFEGSSQSAILEVEGTNAISGGIRTREKTTDVKTWCCGIYISGEMAIRGDGNLTIESPIVFMGFTVEGTIDGSVACYGTIKVYGVNVKIIGGAGSNGAKGTTGSTGSWGSQASDGGNGGNGTNGYKGGMGAPGLWGSVYIYDGANVTIQGGNGGNGGTGGTGGIGGHGGAGKNGALFIPSKPGGNGGVGGNGGSGGDGGTGYGPIAFGTVYKYNGYVKLICGNGGDAGRGGNGGKGGNGGSGAKTMWGNPVDGGYGGAGGSGGKSGSPGAPKYYSISADKYDELISGSNGENKLDGENGFFGQHG